MQELDLKTQHNKLLEEYLQSAATFVGVSIIKSASNKLYSRSHNDNIDHQTALTATEIIISAHNKLQLEPALEFFDMDESRFLEAAHDHVLVEYANAQDLITHAYSLSASISIAADYNLLKDNANSIDITEEEDNADNSNKLNNEMNNNAKSNETNNTNTQNNQNDSNVSLLPSALVQTRPIIENLYHTKRRKTNDSNLQANIGLSLEAARASN